MVEPTGHCPYLGLKQNQAIRFASPTPEHRCYVTGQAQDIPVPQAEYCLSSGHINCPLYIGLTASTIPHSRSRVEEAPAPPRGVGGWINSLNRRDRLIYTFLVGLLGVIFVIYAAAGVNLFFGTNTATQPTGVPPIADTATSTPTNTAEPPTSTATASSTPSPTRTTTPTATRTSTPTVTPFPTGYLTTPVPTSPPIPTQPPPPPTISLPTTITLPTDTAVPPTETVPAGETPSVEPSPTSGEAPTNAPTEAPTATSEPPTEAPTATSEPPTEAPTPILSTAEPATPEPTAQRTPAP